MQKWIVLALALGAGVSACDKDPSGPSLPVPRIQVVAGGNTADTVDALPVQALSVEIIGPDGRPASGTPVLFESVSFAAGTWHARPTMLVGSVLQTTLSTARGDTTNSTGRVAVRVRFGSVAGEGKIVVTVPTLGLQDTVRYTVRPGAPVRMTISPADTAITVGKQYVLRGHATDRYGNVRPDTAGFSVRAGPASVAGDRVTATGIGRVSLLARIGTFEDSAHLSVVPEGTLAVFQISSSRDSTGVAVVNLDGSGYRRLADAAGLNPDHMAPHWSPTGEEVLFTYGTRIDWDSRLFRVGLTGSPRAFFEAETRRDSWGRFSRDGEWIFFLRAPEVWRARSDGTAAERLVAATEDFWTHGPPDPSPDGTRVAFMARGFSGNRVRILTLATGEVTTLSVPGNVPRWSPDGEWLAFVNEHDGSIGVVRPDGSGMRTVFRRGMGLRVGHDWSPDGRWLVTGGQGSILYLINVETGETLPLPFTRWMTQPSWRR